MVLRYRRNKRFRKRRYNDYRIAKIAKQVVMSRKRVGMKIVDLNTSFNSVSTTATEVDLTDIDLGTGSGSRIGQTIIVKNVRLYGALYIGDATNEFRITCALWSSDTTPFATNGIDYTTFIHPLNNQATCNGLKWVYYDKITTLNTTDKNSQIIKMRPVKINKRIMYHGDGTTADSKLILSMISDSAGVPNPGFVSGYAVIIYLMT